MNHTEAVTAKKVREFESLRRLVQTTQRAYGYAKEAEANAQVPHDEYQRRAFEYHDLNAILERKLMEACGVTEVDLQHRSYAVLNNRSES